MHDSSRLRMQWFIENFIPEGPANVLDVGSYSVNGSYQDLFPEPRFNYTGMDMEAGPNVDLVEPNPYVFKSLLNDQKDVVISGQAFEHIEFFWITMAEMVRVTKPGGLICIIAPQGFNEHRYPVDCYRFFTDGMAALARYCQLEILHAHTNKGPEGVEGWHSDSCADSMLVAKKTYSGRAKLIDPLTYTCTPPDHSALNGGLV